MLDEVRGTGVRDRMRDGVRGTVPFSAVMRRELVRPSCGEGCLAAARNRLIAAARNRLIAAARSRLYLPPRGAGCFGRRAERAVLPPRGTG